MTEGFTGFLAETFAFLEGLEANNSKAWFDANRATYQLALVEPSRALVTDLGSALQAKISPGIEADPRVGRSLYRINRDLRFSKDKTPYNPYLDMSFWEGAEPRRSPALLLRITARDVTLGAGLFQMDASGLDRYRVAVIAGATGGALEQAVAGLDLMPPERKTVPRGFPADHPRAALLRHDGLCAFETVALPSQVYTPWFVDWCVERYARYAPLHRWLVEVVGTPG